tara:strand:- start:1388 stop:1645 length:258 start_codon:yes stop_codon:yes gene_type:complete
MRIKEKKFIRLSEDMVFKLDIIKSSLSEEISNKKIIDLGINTCYETAIRILWLDDQITRDGLDYAIQYLPDFMIERLMGDLGLNE